MPHTKLLILNIIIVLTLFGCSNEPPEIEDLTPLGQLEYYEELDISYGDNINQKFDLY